MSSKLAQLQKFASFLKPSTLKPLTFSWQSKILTSFLLLNILHTAGLLAPSSQVAAYEGESTSKSDAYVNINHTPPEIAWGTHLNDPKAIVLCIHGLGLHKATYDEFGKALVRLNIEVHAMDIRGFGEWYLKGKDQLDFAGAMSDIKAVLSRLHERRPGVPVYLLGESMGGAIALQAAAQYPELVQGLISSVPSGDRWTGLGDDLKVGSHVLFGGFNKRFNVGQHVVTHATDKPDLQSRWEGDPSCRAQFSPSELIQFQNFMKQNNEAASAIKTLPVLVVQGAQDKLVRPGGTWNVWEHLSTPDKQVVVSKTAEHLIFEFGQFNADDIKFVSNWLNKKLSARQDTGVIEEGTLALKKPSTLSSSEILAGGPQVVAGPTPLPNNSSPSSSSTTSPVSHSNQVSSLSYWIELMRDGKRYRCNNKTTFKSGDEIRIHVTSDQAGYAYILLKQGTSGAHTLLFPDQKTGQNNKIQAQMDYALPSATWLKFDEHEGREKVALVFSPNVLDPNTNRYLNSSNIVISSDRSGAKDLCPTRMQISWDDPNPLIIPPDTAAVPVSNSSAVKVSGAADKVSSIVALDIDLDHQK